MNDTRKLYPAAFSKDNWIQHNPEYMPSSRPWTLVFKPRVHSPYNTGTIAAPTHRFLDTYAGKEVLTIELDIIILPANHIEGFADIHCNSSTT